MTRARNELQLCVPLKFPLTQQSRSGDAHVYGARSRFMSDKVLNSMTPAVYQSAQLAPAMGMDEASSSTLNVAARLKDMW
jgi:DNA helicase-2/ATP-dependent DNA helicase PcrA